MSDNFGLENGEDDDDDEEDSSSSRKLVYHPSLVSPYKLWYKGHYMTISRETRWATIKIKYDILFHILVVHSTTSTAGSFRGIENSSIGSWKTRGSYTRPRRRNAFRFTPLIRTCILATL